MLVTFWFLKKETINYMTVSLSDRAGTYHAHLTIIGDIGNEKYVSTDPVASANVIAALGLIVFRHSVTGCFVVLTSHYLCRPPF